MILVAGGTGRLGTLVVRQLSEAGLRVRVLTRDPRRAEHLNAAHVEVVTGDVRDRRSLASAFAGVDSVVSAVQGFAGKGGVSPSSIDRDGNINLIEAARDAGADMVLVSVIGAAANSPMELFRMKYAAEQRLKGSGVPFTIVRASAFLELWIELMQDTAKRSGRPMSRPCTWAMMKPLITKKRSTPSHPTRNATSGPDDGNAVHPECSITW